MKVAHFKWVGGKSFPKNKKKKGLGGVWGENKVPKKKHRGDQCG
jgi:hypothetical protein